MNAAVKQFQTFLRSSLPESKILIDEPAGEGANWWIDVRLGKRRLTLEFSPDHGFGILARNSSYGQGPSEIYRTAKLAALRSAQILQQANRSQDRLTLKQVRELYSRSQTDLASKLGIKQSAVSRFEQRGDVKVATLVSAIKALGGELELRARFPDAVVPLDLDSKSSR
jgi:hypothetical protein